MIGIIVNAIVWFFAGWMMGNLWAHHGYTITRKSAKKKRKCECHERDGSYTCQYCKDEYGLYGHMEQK